jgi:Replication initiator protein, pSAM2
MPLARDVVKDIAINHGGCIRPVQLRRTDLTTGETEQVLVPCGHTLASVCPACAERAKNLRAAQCREGWHLDHEPHLEPDPATGTGTQQWWIEKRADIQARRDQPPHPAKTPTTWRSCSANWTRRSTGPGCGAR